MDTDARCQQSFIGSQMAEQGENVDTGRISFAAAQPGFINMVLACLAVHHDPIIIINTNICPSLVMFHVSSALFMLSCKTLGNEGVRDQLHSERKRAVKRKQLEHRRQARGPGAHAPIDSNMFQFRCIGKFESCFKEKHGLQPASFFFFFFFPN